MDEERIHSAVTNIINIDETDEFSYFIPNDALVEQFSMTYRVNGKMTIQEYEDLVFEIASYTKKLSNEWSKDRPIHRIFIGGDHDKRLTLYEQQSNSGRIGVIARSKTMGHMMLLLLRMIIDRNPDLILTLLDEYKYQELTMDQIILILEQTEAVNAHCFKMTDDILLPIYQTVPPQIKQFDRFVEKNYYWTSPSKRMMIQKTLDQIDLWTMERIENELLILFNEDNTN